VLFCTRDATADEDREDVVNSLIQWDF